MPYTPIFATSSNKDKKSSSVYEPIFAKKKSTYEPIFAKQEPLMSYEKPEVLEKLKSSYGVARQTFDYDKKDVVSSPAAGVSDVERNTANINYKTIQYSKDEAKQYLDKGWGKDIFKPFDLIPKLISSVDTILFGEKEKPLEFKVENKDKLFKPKKIEKAIGPYKYPHTKEIIDQAKNVVEKETTPIPVNPIKEAANDVRLTSQLFLLSNEKPLYAKAIGGNVIKNAINGVGGIRTASVVDDGLGDKLENWLSKPSEKLAEKDKFAASTLESLSYSLTSSIPAMGVGLGVGTVTRNPLAGTAAASATAGILAYNMSTHEIMKQYLELKNEEKIVNTGNQLTKEEENKLKKEFNSTAIKYGLWEAVPEMLSGGLGYKFLLSPLTKSLGSKEIAETLIGRLTGFYSGEVATETITQMGQQETLKKISKLGGKDIDWTSKTDWIEALSDVAPQTILLTTILGGSTSLMVKKETARRELGQTPYYEQVIKKIEEIAKEIPIPFSATIEDITKTPPAGKSNVEIDGEKFMQERQREQQLAQEPQEIDDKLIEEADKIIAKSKTLEEATEEFVRAQGTPVYRGQTKKGGVQYNETGFQGNTDGGVFFTTDSKIAGKHGDNIIENISTKKNTVSVKESDELQKMAETQVEKDLKNMVESDELIEQMALGRPRAFAEYTKKPFVETGDKFGETGELIYYKELDRTPQIKSQLTDIFNQVKQAESPDVKTTAEAKKALKQAEAISRPAKPNEVKKAIKEEKAPFVITKKRETTLLKDRIKQIQKEAKQKAWSEAKLQQKINKLTEKAERDVRKAELKGLRQTIKDKIKALARGQREGAKLTRDTIADVQDKLRRLVKDSELEAKYRDKFTDMIKNIAKAKDPIAKMEKILPDVETKISELEDIAERKNLVSQIKKELNKLTSKKDQKGKTTVIFEMLRNGYKQILNNTQSENIALQKNLEKKLELSKEVEPVNAQDKVTYALLSENTKGIEELNNFELDEILTRLQQTRKIARDSFLWKKIEEGQRISEQIDEGVELVDVKGQPDEVATNRKKIWAKLGDGINLLDIWDRGFKQIMTLLDRTAHTRFFRDVIYQPIAEANKTYLVDKFKYVEQDNKMYKDVFKIKDIKGLNKTVQNNRVDRLVKRLTKKNRIGILIDAKGEKAELYFSQSELIDIYVSGKAEANRTAMMENGIYIGQKGQKKKIFYFTDDNFKVLEKAMKPESKKIADYIQKQVKDKEFGDKVNIAYERKWNKPFNRVEGGYWTLNRKYEGAKDDAINMLKPEYSNNAIMSPSSHKARTDSKRPIEVKDAIAKYAKWREDNLRFLHYDETFNNILPVLSSSRFKNVFIETYGKKAYDHLYDSFFYVANGGNIYDDIWAKGANVLRSVLAIQHLGGRSRALLTQGGSALASISDIPVKEFTKYTGIMVSNPKKAFDKMMESPLVRFRHRQANFNRGLFEQELASYNKQGVKLTDIWMSPVKGGDMIGVIGAGYTVYKYNFDKLIKEGVSDIEANKKAMQMAENFILDTQQSSLPEYANKIMQMHPTIKITGAYEQTPSMYRARGFEAIKEWQTSKKTKEDTMQMVKEVGTYHLFLPVVFEITKGNFNPYSIVSNALMSPIRGYMGYGKVVSYAIQKALLIPLFGLLFSLDDDEKKELEPFSPIKGLADDALQTFDKTLRGIDKAIDGKDDWLFDVLSGIGTISKIPIKNLKEEEEKISDVIESESGLRRLLETSWQYEQRQKKETKKVDPRRKKGTNSSREKEIDKRRKK